ncbi:MAG: peptidase domain-containing ABC transporter [Vicinamibacterales bacterium]|nr:peptidase domain-containing ABC transporter [Vicinamibacterales bacterium]
MGALSDIEALRLAPPFAGLAERQLHAIADRCRRTLLQPGAVATQGGVVPDALHVILRGHMRIVDERLPGQAVHIDDLGHGGHAGESVIDASAAPFSVYCVTEVEALQLTREDLRELVAAWPDIDVALRARLDQRHALTRTGLDSWSPDPEPAAPSAGTAPPEAGIAHEEAPWLDAGAIAWTRPCAVPAPALKRPPVVRQLGPADAGPACLSSVSRYYGRRISLGTARAAGGGRRDTALRAMARAAGRLGFEAVAARATLAHLTRNHRPALARLADGHWVVVDRIDRGSVGIIDPASGRRRATAASFLDTWTGETLYLRPTDRFFDTPESARPWRRFLAYVRPWRVLLAEIVLASVLVQFFSLLLPVFARFVIDEVIGRRDQAWLGPALLGMCGVLVLSWLVGGARQHLLGVVSRRVDARIAGDVHRHLLGLPLRFFESRHVGDTVGHFEETARITAFLTGTGVGFLIDVLTAGLAVAVMGYYNLTLTAVAAGCVVLEVVQLSFVTPRLNRGAREVARRGVDSEGLLLEAFSGLSTIKVLAVEHYTRWKLENRLIARLNASFRTLRYRTLAALGSQTAGHLAPIGVLFYGAVLALRGEISVGVLVAFVMLARLLAAPFGAMAAVWERFQDALASVDVVNDVLETPPESPPEGGDLVTLQRLHGHIRFDAVGFRYEHDGPEILRDLTFECYGGQRVAIVGPSGSGKSTLIKLLLGFYRPTAGTIAVDGFDLGDIWLPSFRRQAGVVLQDPTLFKGAIRANIGQTMRAAPLADVVSAARMANAHGFVSRLSHGYETLLDENGANLSGGQRQQVALARALLHRPRMLVLDEATSNLDEESERLLQQNLDTHFRDSTVFTITQRLSSVRHADLVLVLDRGRVVEQGHPEHLLSQRGLFYRLSVEQDPERRRTA